LNAIAATLARPVRLVLLLAAALGASAAAPPPPTVRLEELTSSELAAEIAAGSTTIIVPIGGTEQNGPHMVLGKHNARAKALAERIARQLGNALVAPVIAYVPEGAIEPPTAHMRWPGTISVSDQTFARLLESAARSFRHHGFRDIVLLGDHGGYQKIDRAVAAKLNREWAATRARVHAIDAYYEAVETDYPRMLRQRGYADAEIGTHAGLADTSLALAIDPALVRAERMRSADAVAKGNGVAGDPRRSSAELGQLGVDAIVARSVAAIREAVARRQ
jgi:creatinine amidohydrolase/Fe(II)-dependent formamide hydrolase-like protein